MKRFVYALTAFTIIFVIAGVGVLLLYPRPMKNSTQHSGSVIAQTNLPQKNITLGGVPLSVSVASTEPERELGLSGHVPLLDGEGMLFVFDTPSDWGIWMKDMEFPLDILWANKDGVVTTVAADVATSTYPEVFRPKTADASYVVELPAGFLQKKGIREGAMLTL